MSQITKSDVVKIVPKTISKEKFFSFEHITSPLLSLGRFYKRLWKYILLATILMGVSLLIGILWYHYLGSIWWIDSLLNASMILGGMWPVDVLQTDRAKIFASFYALYSGMLLLSVFGFVMAPVIHRILHKMHFSEK